MILTTYSALFALAFSIVPMAHAYGWHALWITPLASSVFAAGVGLILAGRR